MSEKLSLYIYIYIYIVQIIKQHIIKFKKKLRDPKVHLIFLPFLHESRGTVMHKQYIKQMLSISLHINRSHLSFVTFR